MGSSAHGDVRMRGFVERLELGAALERLRPLVSELGAEEVGFEAGLGRVLAEPVVSRVDVPGFAKSAVDGYALRGEESFGAGTNEPIALSLVGEIFPGQLPGLRIGTGQAARIMTGGPIPDGANAVLMAEYAEERDQVVRITEPVPPGKNIVGRGEDVREGEEILARGRRLRPQDLGALASIGQSRVALRRKPRVAIATTGNELVAPEELARAGPSAVVNSNSYVLEALVRELGGEPVRMPIVPDALDAVTELLRSFPGDLLLTTGGTSVGLEDYLPVALRAEGELVVHGIDVRPGSPTGFGRVGERIVFLLPGHPVAAMVGFELLVRPCLFWMLGADEPPRPRIQGRLTRKIASALNRVDFVRVRVNGAAVEPLRSSGAALLTSMTRADGYLLVPRDLEGYEAGSLVEVTLFG